MQSLHNIHTTKIQSNSDRQSTDHIARPADVCRVHAVIFIDNNTLKYKLYVQFIRFKTCKATFPIYFKVMQLILFSQVAEYLNLVLRNTVEITLFGRNRQMNTLRIVKFISSKQNTTHNTKNIKRKGYTIIFVYYRNSLVQVSSTTHKYIAALLCMYRIGGQGEATQSHAF